MCCPAQGCEESENVTRREKKCVLCTAAMAAELSTKTGSLRNLEQVFCRTGSLQALQGFHIEFTGVSWLAIQERL